MGFGALSVWMACLMDPSEDVDAAVHPDSNSRIAAATLMTHPLLSNDGSPVTRRVESSL